MFQQTPLAVTAAPPSVVTLPPQVASVVVILDTVDVVKVGRTIGTSFLHPTVNNTGNVKIMTDNLVK